jgi:hypothetical protein
MAAAPKKAGARKVTTKRAPVKRTESDDSEGGIAAAVAAAKALPTPEQAAAQVNSPYPKGVVTWTYQPKDEKSALIVLPVTGIRPGDKLWHFDLAQLPILAQTWKWMDRANVPKQIQRQCQLLADDEYFEMFNAWFDAMKAAVAPKGSLTAGK